MNKKQKSANNIVMALRKSLEKPEYYRVLKIDEELSASVNEDSTGYTCRSYKYFETHYGFKEQSVRRTIEYMKAMYGCPIKHDKKRGFYYTKKSFRLPAFFATAEDLMAIDLVKQLIVLYRNTPMQAAAEKLLEFVSKPIGEEKSPEWYKDRIIIPKMFARKVNQDVWECILAGLKENRKVEIMYLTADKKATNKPGNNQRLGITKRIVHPYQMIFNKNEWLLSGYDEKVKRKGYYHVSRIRGVSLLHETFMLKKEFIEKEERSDKKNTGKKKLKFVIEYYGDKRYFIRRKMTKDQKIKETKNGLEISFTSDMFDGVLNWVKSLGVLSKPLKPKKLVDAWKKI